MDALSGQSSGGGSSAGGRRSLGVSPYVRPVTSSPLDWNGVRFPGTAAANWGPMGPTAFRLSEWTPDNLTMALLGELIPLTVGGVTWSTALTTGGTDDWTTLSATEQAAEREELRNLIEFRPAALSEILAQRNGIIGYMRSVVYFTRSSHPITYLLAASALRAGQFLVMHYKLKFKRPRPTSVQPGLIPWFDVPGHASCPSGHATEAMLIALMLEQILPAGTIPTAGAEAGPLRTLARRIARNREVAGLHFPSDTRIGHTLAARSFPLLLGCPNIAGTTGVALATAASQPVITDLRPTSPVTEPVAPTPLFSDGLLAKARAEWT